MILIICFKKKLQGNNKYFFIPKRILSLSILFTYDLNSKLIVHENNKEQTSLVLLLLKLYQVKLITINQL